MERYFYRRGKKVLVSEVEGVVAVQVDAASRASVRAEAFGQPIEAARGVPFTSDASTEEVEALKSAGWVFVQPSREFAASALSVRDRPAEVQEVGPVYQQSDGHILIGGRNLIVQLSPALSDVAARRELKKRKLTIIRPLAFAPNQFQVEIPPGEDLLAVANALQESDIAVAAEPDFIEHIGPALHTHGPDLRPAMAPQ